MHRAYSLIGERNSEPDKGEKHSRRLGTRAKEKKEVGKGGKSLTEDMTFEKRPKRSEGGNHVGLWGVWREEHSRGENCRCKGPGGRMCLMCLRKMEEASGAAAE